jgi:hypothetical protein
VSALCSRFRTELQIYEDFPTVPFNCDVLRFIQSSPLDIVV